MAVAMTERISNQCPHCDNLNDRVSMVAAKSNRNEPVFKKGDITICINCGEWSVNTGGGMLRKPTNDEIINIGKNKVADAVRAAWLRMKSTQR